MSGRIAGRLRWGEFVDWAFLLLVSTLLVRLTDSVVGLEAKVGVLVEKVEAADRVKTDHESRIRRLEGKIR